ncbi:MAG TPA: hypothetical protein VGI39_17985 [Polyangiaceae bacterium]|jgi:hypothetical protein
MIHLLHPPPTAETWRGRIPSCWRCGSSYEGELADVRIEPVNNVCAIACPTCGLLNTVTNLPETLWQHVSGLACGPVISGCAVAQVEKFQRSNPSASPKSSPPWDAHIPKQGGQTGLRAAAEVACSTDSPCGHCPACCPDDPRLWTENAAPGERR